MTQHSGQVAVVRGELFDLCGDFRKAAILNQFLYWLPRLKDIDEYLTEEQDRRGSDKLPELTRGWMWKSGEELAIETMCGSPSTVLRHLDALVERGFIDKRNNPSNGWDRTFQYRVNVRRVERALNKGGCSLQTVMGAAFYRVIAPILQNEKCIPQNDDSIPQNDDSIPQNEGAIPKTTPKTTSKTSVSTRARVKDRDPVEIYKEHLRLWMEETNQRGPVGVHPHYQELIRHHVNDPIAFDAFCEMYRLSEKATGGRYNMRNVRTLLKAYVEQQALVSPSQHDVDPSRRTTQHNGRRASGTDGQSRRRIGAQSAAEYLASNGLTENGSHRD